jgi:hypothetical protein
VVNPKIMITEEESPINRERERKKKKRRKRTV